MAETAFVVEVAYATKEKQKCLSVNLPLGSSIRSAIERSRIADHFPEIDLAKNKVGVWGKIRSLDDLVSNGDRVEIYRPLLIDPKEARRQRSLLPQK